MSALDRKMTRDLWRLKGQVATIALVLACGIMAMIMLRGTYGSLVAARDVYYADERFADVFVRAERAPEAVGDRLARLPGVARVYTRVVEDVMLPLEDELDPVPARIVSIPADGVPPLNGLRLVAGRLPGPRAADEAVVLEQFARAHGLEPGDRFPAVLNGNLRRIRVVGLGMSPEYVLAISGRELMVDERRFAVLWMSREAVAPTFRMEGAFNDASIALEPGASEPAVLAAVDRELARYGGFHAVGRDRQQSNYALHGELDNLRSLAVVIPLVFLAVAAFLVNVVISRLVYLERTQIAVLKALGFGDRRIAFHYLGLVALIVALAAALGIALGVWSGRWMTDLYTEFYRFPGGGFRLSGGLVSVTVGIGLAAAVVGALGAVRRVSRMPPAQAMRPPAPLSYRRSLLERAGLGRVLGPAAMMTAREIQRRPLRFALSAAGIAMGVAIFVMGRFSWDSFDHLMDEQFAREHEEDLTVAFIRARPAGAVSEIAHLPGVLRAEGQRAVPVRLRAGSRWRDSVIIGMPEPPRLRHLLDGGRVEVVPPPDGVLMTDRLADALGVRVGDHVTAEILEGDWPVRQVLVGGLIDEPFGLQTYARAAWLSRLLREEPRVTTVFAQVDAAASLGVRERLKRLPGVAAAISTARVRANYEKHTGGSMWVMTLILTLSAAAIAIGVVYNNARISLSLRSRDLASLRVLGFTRREISTILLGEISVQVAVGIPLGLVLGRIWAGAYAASLDPELMRFPLHIAPHTYAAAALIALGAGLISAFLVRRRLDDLDLVAVLKSSE